MATQFLTLVNGYPTMATPASQVALYDQLYTPTSVVTAGTPVSLPLGQTYTGAELIIELNGQDLSVGPDFSYVGTGTRTQVSFPYDLLTTDTVRFKIIRGP